MLSLAYSMTSASKSAGKVPTITANGSMTTSASIPAPLA